MSVKRREFFSSDELFHFPDQFDWVFTSIHIYITTLLQSPFSSNKILSGVFESGFSNEKNWSMFTLWNHFLFPASFYKIRERQMLKQHQLRNVELVCDGWCLCGSVVPRGVDLFFFHACMLAWWRVWQLEYICVLDCYINMVSRAPSGSREKIQTYSIYSFCVQWCHIPFSWFVLCIFETIKDCLKLNWISSLMNFSKAR